MKRLLLATALLASLAACSNWHHRGSESSSSAPPNSVNAQQGSYANPAQAPASQGEAGVHTGPQPGESGVSGSSSALSGGGSGH